MTAVRLLALLLLLAGTASAQPYRWVDEEGRVQYSDTPPPPGARSVQKKQFQSNVVGGQGSYDLEKAMRESPVTLYSHPDCKDCQIARDVLNQRGIPFKEVVVDDQPKLDELKRVSGGINVPVLVVGGQVDTVISAQAYNRALDFAGYPPVGVARPRNQEEPRTAAPEPAAEPAPERRGPYAPR